MGRVLLRMDTFPEKVFVSLLIPQGVCSWIQVVKKIRITFVSDFQYNALK
jgi:hypothetical protein